MRPSFHVSPEGCADVVGTRRACRFLLRCYRRVSFEEGFKVVMECELEDCFGSLRRLSIAQHRAKSLAIRKVVGAQHFRGHASNIYESPAFRLSIFSCWLSLETSFRCRMQALVPCLAVTAEDCNEVFRAREQRSNGILVAGSSEMVTHQLPSLLVFRRSKKTRLLKP